VLYLANAFSNLFYLADATSLARQAEEEFSRWVRKICHERAAF